MNSFRAELKLAEQSIKRDVLPFSDFLNELKIKVRRIFNNRENNDQLSLNRGIPPFALREIMSGNPLSVSIPKEYGGRGGLVHENIALLSMASYESLALSLTLGINSALFLQPVAKYARDETKETVFKRFLAQKNMGGLMITEPGFGSDALNMQTHYSEANGEFHIQGKKHWAGLTGLADFWLLTARKKADSGNLQRDIDFFVCDVHSPGQEIEVEELFDNLGLYMIPYGRNKINVKVPESHKLQPHTTGVKMMLDLLHRSRMHFPGLGMGFIQRMLDEAIDHCKQRFVGGKSLFGYDQVQERLSKIQASYTICSAMCANSSAKAGIENDLAPHGIEANAVKSVITDLMHNAAQSVLQLVGAKAYKLNHIAGRGTVDSRPFQIFEGSNDILYAQISEGLLKLMKRAKENNLFRFFKGFNLTEHAADYIKGQVNFNIDFQMPQRKLVEMGKITGYAISLNQVLDVAGKGFRKDLTEGSIAMLQQEISNLISNFSFKNKTQVVEEYEENSSWLNFVTAKM
ncbi:acyl-CoA dehydrogenase family protein [Mariniphaga sp.]|uniref:acyl-CoA dehydrogenase family protein n=1 Tax=Mariniphaga sp. TaxID=1954475 RepID=UPI0035659098